MTDLHSSGVYDTEISGNSISTFHLDDVADDQGFSDDLALLAVADNEGLLWEANNQSASVTC